MEEHIHAARGRGSILALAIWTAAWVASLAIAKFGSAAMGESSAAVSWILIAVNVAVGVGWIIAHARYLRGVDDLQRKILMDALAVALGAGLVGGLAFSVAGSAGLIAFDSDIAFASILMGVVYLVAVAAGTLRYR